MLLGRAHEGAGKKLREVARALYTPDPTEEEAAGLGLTVEEASGPPVEIWPPNVVPFNVFNSLCTQWRMGSSGPVGLDYNVLFHKLDRMKLPADEYERIERDVRVMEDEALTVIWKRDK